MRISRRRQSVRLPEPIQSGASLHNDDYNRAAAASTQSWFSQQWFPQQTPLRAAFVSTELHRPHKLPLAFVVDTHKVKLQRKVDARACSLNENHITRHLASRNPFPYPDMNYECYRNVAHCAKCVPNSHWKYATECILISNWIRIGSECGSMHDY